MERYAYGILGFTPAVLMEFTPREYYNAFRGKRDQQDAERRITLEAARLTAYYVISSFSDKRINPKDLGEFPWEKG